MEMISEHNAEYDNGEHTFNIGENELADLTPDEIKERMNGLVANTELGQFELSGAASNLRLLPEVPLPRLQV